MVYFSKSVVVYEFPEKTTASEIWPYGYVNKFDIYFFTIIIINQHEILNVRFYFIVLLNK